MWETILLLPADQNQFIYLLIVERQILLEFIFSVFQFLFFDIQKAKKTIL